MRIILAGGGSGGHIYPLIALARELRRRNPAMELVYIGQSNSREEREAALEKIPFQAIHRQDNRREKPWHYASSLFWAGFGALQSVHLMRRLKPVCLIGAGGFVSLPVLMGARASRVPYILLEQNTIPGKVTRAYSHGARAVFLTFPGSERFLARSSKTQVVGNPIRQDLLPSRQEARRRLGIPQKALLLVIAGGSQGSLRLNETVFKALPELLSTYPDLIVLWATGVTYFDRFQEAVGISERLHLVDYEKQMPLWIASADLFLGRAGSGMISEALAAGVPSLLIPFPYAADGHQVANARFLEENGAAKTLPEEALGELFMKLQELLSQREVLSSMSKAARALGKPEAAGTVADWVLVEFHP